MDFFPPFPFIAVNHIHTVLVSTSNSFCNKGFQNLLSLLRENNKEWNKQGRWLYVILSFQILVPSCYELHVGGLLYCASVSNKIKSLRSYKEKVHLWYKGCRSMKNDLIFEENVTYLESVQVWNSPNFNSSQFHNQAIQQSIHQFTVDWSK